MWILYACESSSLNANCIPRFYVLLELQPSTAASAMKLTTSITASGFRVRALDIEQIVNIFIEMK